MTWLLRLYPRAWQRRYGEEVAELLASEPPSLRLLVDLIAGAIDARLNPHWTPVSTSGGGAEAMDTFLRSCAGCRLSVKDSPRSSAWLIGVSLASVLLALSLQFTVGRSPFSMALLLAGFPIALLVTAHQSVEPKPYSRAARMILLIGSIIAIYGFMLVVAFIAELT